MLDKPCASAGVVGEEDCIREIVWLSLFRVLIEMTSATIGRTIDPISNAITSNAMIRPMVSSIVPAMRAL
jgi:hypothetical protein